MERLAAALTRWCTRWVPDAYVLAALLTLLVFVAALAVGADPLATVRFWGEGFWSQFSFTLRMAMVIMTGYLVADAPIVKRRLRALAAWPATPRSAVALVAMVSMTLGWVNWGVSIIASALLAREIGRRRIGVDFRLLVASAYLGLGCMWHAGLSASAPLTSSDPNERFVKDYFGGVAVPTTDTVFSPFNLGLAFAVLVVMTLVATALQPRAPMDNAPAAATPGEESDDPDEDRSPAGRPTTPAQWLEHTPIVTLIVVAAVFIYLPMDIATKGARRITIDHVNLAFLGLGALLHWTPASFLRSAERGGRYVWGVLLQFCFYAGIGGMLDKSGLASNIAGGFTRVATPRSYPLFVVWYSGLLNYMVPSGGAKWFIEVPYLAEASHRLGVPMSKTIVAYAWGDMLTDIIQPFWAIPLLAVARLGFRDIMGYCLLFFMVYATMVSAAFLAWGYL